MVWPPLIERELRVALRKKQPARSRLMTASALVAVSLAFLLIGVLTNGREAGRRLHQLLFLVGLYWVVRTPGRIAGAFAEERRCRTLGLLFLSGLGAAEVFASKVLSSALIALTDLLAMFPMLALPFLVGGTSYDLFLDTVVCLPNLMLLALAVGLLASALTVDESAAVVLAAALGTAICALPVAVYYGLWAISAGQPSLGWLRLSPGWAAWSIWDAIGIGRRADVWTNFGVTLGWSAICLGGAAIVLKRLWRGQEEGAPRSVWRQRWQSWVHGDSAWRKRLAAEWLDAKPPQGKRPFRAGNPFVWLAARDRQPAVLAWLVVGGITGAWLLCWALWRARWPSVPNFFITATLLLSSLAWIIRQTAAKALADARHDGSYELLLTTPLQPSEIVSGGLGALGWHFRAVGRCVLGLDALMLFAGLALRPWQPGALFVYLAVWAWLLWLSWRLSWDWRSCLLVMWAGLNSGRPALAVWRATGVHSHRVIALCWVFNVFCFWGWKTFSHWSSFPSGSTNQVVLASCAALLLLLSLLGAYLGLDKLRAPRERRLVAEFRDIVREPLPDRDDRRFRKWNHHERFPWWEWEALQQRTLGETLWRNYPERFPWWRAARRKPGIRSPAEDANESERPQASRAHPDSAPGVRPSPGAAATERAGAPECLTATLAPGVAAPEDGRTPGRFPAVGAVSGGAQASPEASDPSLPASGPAAAADAPAPAAAWGAALSPPYPCGRGQPWPAQPLKPAGKPLETETNWMLAAVGLLGAGAVFAVMGAAIGVVAAAVYHLVTHPPFGSLTEETCERLVLRGGCAGACIGGVLGLIFIVCFFLVILPRQTRALPPSRRPVPPGNRNRPAAPSRRDT